METMDYDDIKKYFSPCLVAVPNCHFLKMPTFWLAAD
jgi:hypothetical protein